MKAVIRSLRSVGLAFGVFGLLVGQSFAGYHFAYAGGFGPPWDNGSVSSVPSGAYYEWEAFGGSNGYAQVLIGGGGLNVNQSAGAGQHFYDVGATSYADSLSYQISAIGDGTALFYVGW